MAEERAAAANSAAAEGKTRIIIVQTAKELAAITYADIVTLREIASKGKCTTKLYFRKEEEKENDLNRIFRQSL